LEWFKNIVDGVPTANVQHEVSIGVDCAVGFRLGLGGDPGYGPGGGCLDRCTCGRHEVHPLVDAFWVLRGTR
jgi:hypothetical protein